MKAIPQCKAARHQASFFWRACGRLPLVAGLMILQSGLAPLRSEQAGAGLPGNEAGSQCVELVPEAVARTPDGPLMQTSLEMMASRHYRALAKPAASQISAPDCQNAAAFEIVIAGQAVPVIFDYSESGEGRLYIDLEGKGDLKRAKPLVSRNLRSSSTEGWGYYEFYPITMAHLPGSDSEGVPFAIAVTKFPLRRGNDFEGYLRVLPVSRYKARASLGGREVEISLADGDYDGKLAPGRLKDTLEREGGPAQHDYIGIEWDGSRLLDYRGEVLPLTRELGLGQKFYVVSPAEDSATLTFTEIEPQLATIEAASPLLEMVLTSPHCVVLLDCTPAKKWQVPAGDFQLTTFRLRGEQNGKKWVLHGGRERGRWSRLALQAGTTTTVKFGEPLRPKFDVRWRGTTAELGFDLTGAGGETYEAGAYAANARQSAPRFRITSRSGKEIAKGAFEYG